MTEKKKNTVQTVEKNIQKKEIEPSAPIQIPKKAIALAKSVGIDLNLIVGEFQRLNERVENTEKAIMILAETNQKLQPLVELAERAKQRQQQIAEAQARGESPQQGGRGAGLLGTIIDKALSGGGGSNPAFEKWQNTMMDLSLENLKKRNLAEDMGIAFQKALIIKMVPSLADQLLGIKPSG